MAQQPLPTTLVRTLSGHKGPLHAVKFNHDGRYCVTAGSDKTFVLWNPYRSAPPGDASAGALLVHRYIGHGYEIVDVAISDDNARIVTCGGDRCAFVWDTSTGGIVRKLFGHEQRLSAVALNADASIMFTGSHDKCLRVWDLRSQSRASIQTMSDFHDNVTSILDTRDIAGCSSSIIASSFDGTVRSYDLRVGKCFTDNLGAPVAALALSQDRNCVLASIPFKGAAAGTGGGGDLLLMEREGGSVLNRCENPLLDQTTAVLDTSTTLQDTDTYSLTTLQVWWSWAPEFGVSARTCTDVDRQPCYCAVRRRMRAIF
jgi:mitogen-activated protein kinase organizer 1